MGEENEAPAEPTSCLSQGVSEPRDSAVLRVAKSGAKSRRDFFGASGENVLKCLLKPGLSAEEAGGQKERGAVETQRQRATGPI